MLDYHRRVIVSLLSSEWDQVVPTSYHRQNFMFWFWYFVSVIVNIFSVKIFNNSA